MTTTLEKNEIVNVRPEEFGLDAKRAEHVSAMFKPMLDKMVELEGEFNQWQKLPSGERKSRLAKELRLKYVKARTGTAKIHKELKAESLAFGRFIDGWKNAQAISSGTYEKELEAEEKREEREAQAKIAALQEEREAELLDTDMPPTSGLGEMSDAVWANLIAGARAAKQARLDAEAKAEADRVIAEARRIAEEKKLRAENERLAEQARAMEAEARAEREARQKADAEAQAILDAERRERERVQAELDAKAREDAEAKARAEREAEEAKAREEATRQAELAKGDGEKVMDWAGKIEEVATLMPEMSAGRYQGLLAHHKARLIGLADELKNAVNE